MSDQRKKRMIKLVMSCTGLFCAGIFYAYYLIPRGVHIPCLFRELTGFRCPGCGITGACLSILHGHPLEAIPKNWGAALITPFVLLLLILQAKHYVDGTQMKKWEKIMAIGCLLELLIWFILRNMMGI